VAHRHKIIENEFRKASLRELDSVGGTSKSRDPVRRLRRINARVGERAKESPLFAHEVCENLEIIRSDAEHLLQPSLVDLPASSDAPRLSKLQAHDAWVHAA